MHKPIRNFMKNFLIGLIFFFTGIGIVFSQDSIPVQTKKPLVKAPFESGYFIDDQTVALPPAHSLQMVIQHRFGTIQNGWTDLAGIWGASNIRFGLDFTINKNVLVGVGTTKNKRIQDLQAKYTFSTRDKADSHLHLQFTGIWESIVRTNLFSGTILKPATVSHITTS